MADLKAYRVREGVDWVNGARVPASRIVDLTEAEARFDREQGRIEPVGAPASPAPPVAPSRKGKSRGRG